MLVSFIIPTFGQWHLTKNCLISLKNELPFPCEILLIDNGANELANDETKIEAPKFGEMLFGSAFKYVPQERNINFAGASNLGAKIATSPLLFFLNNDTIVSKNFLLPLIEFLKADDNLKIVAPLLLYPDRTVQHAGVYINPLMAFEHIYEYFPENQPVILKNRELQCITAAAFLMYKKDFIELGGFDEDFINGFEDVAFCSVLVKNKGKAYVVPDSKIVHYCSQSVGRFDKNKYNLSILHSKNYIQNFNVDYHTLLQNDGYVLRFAENLNFMPTLSDEVKANYNSIIQENNLTNLLDCYKNEPYWHEGFFAIINHKEIDKNLRDTLIKECLFNKFYIELLIEIFLSAKNREGKKLMASLISSYFNRAKNNRENILYDMYKIVEPISQILANDCKFNLENSKNYLSQLEEIENKINPLIQLYL